MSKAAGWEFRPGLELSRALFETGVRPILEAHHPRLDYSFARLAHGSDVLGFDSAVSMDHGWGPRGTLFLRGNEVERLGPELDALLARELPREVLGVPTHMDSPDHRMARPERSAVGPIRHGVRFDTAERFFRSHLGFDPDDGVVLLDWLAVSSQRLRTVDSGCVFHDGMKCLEPRQEAVRWYPGEVWTYLLASQWRRIGQEEPFVGRAGDDGDELGSRVLGSRLCREVMRLAFLQEQRHPPYSKWFGRAFAELDCAAALEPVLHEVAEAKGWRNREESLGRAYREVARRQNALGLGESLEPTLRRFHERPYQVIAADRFAEELERTISDPLIRALPKGLGAVWQLSDSVDLLENPARCRATYTALLGEIEAGGPPSGGTA